MKIQKISAKSDFNALCAKLKVHKMGKKIMSEKKELHFFLIKEKCNKSAKFCLTL